ncbi:MAG: site-specific integrase [Rhodospirillaceae bacterium]
MKRLVNSALLANPPQIPPGKTRLTVFDLKIAGFVLIILTNVMTFYFRWKSGGVSREIKLGRFGDVTVSEARRRAEELRGLVVAGKPPEAGTRKCGLTFAAFVSDHLRPHKAIRKRSWPEDERMIRHRLIPAWGDRLLSSIRTADIQQLCDKIVSHEGRSKSTGNRFVALIKNAFSLARRWGLIDRDPALAVDLFDEPPGRDRVLSPVETAALYGALQTLADRVGSVAILFLLLTGARSGEALAAKWRDISLEDRTWLVPTSKSGRPIRRHLTDLAVSILASLPGGEGDAPVFPSARMGGHRRDLQRPWTSACKIAGISDCRVHDLRHSFASTLVNRGVPLFTIQKLLGHRSQTMSARYSHLVEANLIEATNLASDSFAAAISAAAIANAPATDPATGLL